MRLDVPAAPYYSAGAFFRNTDIPVQVIHVENSQLYPEHHHDFDEIVIICGGKGCHTIGTRNYDVRRGDVFFIAGGTTHSYTDLEKLDYINIIFRHDAFQEDSIRHVLAKLPESGIRLNLLDESIILSIVNRIDRELLEKKFMYALMAQSCLVQLICVLVRSGSESSMESGSGTASRIKAIMNYLENENGPDIPIRLLSEEAGTCTRNFHRVFLRFAGVTPTEFINRQRIRRACELLTETDKTITSISALVNYSDSNYFSRQFRKITGFTPTEYRNSSKQNYK